MKKFVLYGLLTMKTASAFAALSQDALEQFLVQFGENVQIERNLYNLPYCVKIIYPEVLLKEAFHLETQESESHENYPFSQENFEKYSREERLIEYNGETSCTIRIIDYASILDGLGKECKEWARQLENNEDFLTKAIGKWMEGIKISCLFSFIMDDFYIYETYYDITKNKEIKDALKKVFIEMTKYIKSKETLILTLLLGEFVHNPLRFVLSTPLPMHGNKTVISLYLEPNKLLWNVRYKNFITSSIIGFMVY